MIKALRKRGIHTRDRALVPATKKEENPINIRVKARRSYVMVGSLKEKRERRLISSSSNEGLARSSKDDEELRRRGP